MLANVMKRVAIGAVLTALFVSTSTEFQPVLSTIVCVAACLAWYEALERRESGWAGLFATAAFTLNPLVPLRLPNTYALVLSFLGLSLFASSLVHLKQASLAPAVTKGSG